jgi:hypothetical protein
MKNDISKYEVTPIALEYFKQRSFETLSYWLNDDEM